MSRTVKLNIPRTAEERLKAESESIWGLIRRIQTRASDGRYYHFEEEDREKAIGYLKKYAATYGKVIDDLQRFVLNLQQEVPLIPATPPSAQADVREALEQIIISAMSWQPTESGPSYIEKRADLQNMLNAALAPTNSREIRSALANLVAKLNEIHQHPRFKAVWETAQFRLGPYDGPTYVEELDAAEAALAALPSGDVVQSSTEQTASGLRSPNIEDAENAKR